MNTIKENPYLFAGVFFAGLIIGAGALWAFPLPVSAPGGDAMTEEEEGKEKDEDDEEGEKEENGEEGAMHDGHEHEGEKNGEAMKKDTPAATGQGSVNVADQPAGRAVVVSRVSLPSVGWVVVHELRDGALGNALGAARREPGMHADVIVDLLRGTEPDNLYAVLVYEDNGNRAFDLHGDAPFSASRMDFAATTPPGASGE